MPTPYGTHCLCDQCGHVWHQDLDGRLTAPADPEALALHEEATLLEREGERLRATSLSPVNDLRDYMERLRTFYARLDAYLENAGHKR